jgi:hypothetical protein
MGRKLFLFAAAREAAYGPFATVCATPAISERRTWLPKTKAVAV